MWYSETRTVVVEGHWNPDDLEVDGIAVVCPKIKVPRVVLDLVHHIVFALTDQVPAFVWTADVPKVRTAI